MSILTLTDAQLTLLQMYKDSVNSDMFGACKKMQFAFHPCAIQYISSLLTKIYFYYLMNKYEPM